MDKNISPAAFREKMEREKTTYLLRILEYEDKDSWTDEQFQIIRDILIKKGIEIPISTSQLINNYFITTTPIVQEKKIGQYLGIVSSVVVLGTGFLSELGAGIADLLGTRAGTFQEKLKNARDLAVQEMCEQAIQRGGDGIIGVDFDYMTLMSNVLMVSANGTVVRFVSEKDETQT